MTDPKPDRMRCAFAGCAARTEWGTCKWLAWGYTESRDGTARAHWCPRHIGRTSEGRRNEEDSE